MADEESKVEIGFGIGQVLSVKLTDTELKDLRKAVERERGWYDLETQDGSVAINLSTVVFIRHDRAPHSIGFAG